MSDQLKAIQSTVGVTADGKWGPNTQAAVAAKMGVANDLKAIQTKAGVTADGIYGPNTERAIAVELDCVIATPAPAPSSDLKMSDRGMALIRKWEGFAKDLKNGYVEAYPDPATGGAPWTIGIGLTGSGIVKGTRWTYAKAEEEFKKEAESTYAAQVRKSIGSNPTTQDQFDAMTSLCFNIGGGNFGSSTLVKKHNAGDYEGAAQQFRVWNKANGQVMQGLVNRRADEEKMYRGQWTG